MFLFVTKILMLVKLEEIQDDHLLSFLLRWDRVGEVEGRGTGRGLAREETSSSELIKLSTLMKELVH